MGKPCSFYLAGAFSLLAIFFLLEKCSYTEMGKHARVKSVEHVIKMGHIFLMFTERPFQLSFFFSPSVVSLSEFPRLHMNCIKLLYNKHEFLRFLKQGSGSSFYQSCQVFFPKIGEAEVTIFPVCHVVSVSPSSGLKLNFRNNYISKPSKTNNLEGVSS